MSHTTQAFGIVLALTLFWGAVVVICAQEEPASVIERPIKQERVIWV